MTSDPHNKVVMLDAVPDPPASGEPERMAAALRKAPACLTRAQARAAIRAAGEAAGLAEGPEGYRLAEPFADSGTPAGAAQPGCVRITVMVPGAMIVELWE